MHYRSLQWLRLCLIAVLLVAMLPMAVLAQDNTMQGEVVADGLNGPMGVLVDSAGDIWVVDSGTGGDETMEGIGFSGEPVTATMGMTSRVVKISGADGTQTEITSLPSVVAGMEAEGGSRLAELRGITYVTAPGWHPGMLPSTADEPLPLTGSLLRISPSGEAVVAVPMWQYEKNNDVDNELDNHPYGLTATEDGALLMTDAGGNTLYRINPASRRAKLLATFAPLPGVFPNPKYNNEMLTDPVPSGVAVRDGVIYVDFVTGAPYLPGTSKVVTVAEDGTVSDFATGLTMLTDLRTGPDGELYAVQFSVADEQGLTPDSGAIIRVMEGDASEVVVSGLSFPTSIGFSAGGDAYVTVNGVGAPGSGQVLRFANLTSAKGTPIAANIGAGASMAGTETMTDTAEMGSTEAMTDTAEAGATDAMTDTQGMTDGAMAANEGASVLASDQDSDGSSVIVDSVTAAVDGWMVIHADADGKPGAVLGHTAVPAGTTDNVVVILDPAFSSDGTLWAMLHVDAGEMGAYEFPDGPDVPAKENDAIVMAPFMVTLTGAMAADMGATDMMTDTADMGAMEAMTDTADVATADMMTDTAAMGAMESTPEATAAADQAPDKLPATGGDTTAPLAAAVAALSLLTLAGAALIVRRRSA